MASAPQSRSPLVPIITFVAVLLLLFVIFSGSKPPVQSVDAPSAAAKRSMDAIKKHQAGEQALKQ